MHINIHLTRKKLQVTRTKTLGHQRSVVPQKSSKGLEAVGQQTPSNQATTAGNSIICYKSCQPGHRASDCLTQQINIAKDNGIVEEIRGKENERNSKSNIVYENEDKNEQDEEVVTEKGDGAKTLISRNLLLNTPTPADDAKWHVIFFQTTCTIGRKVCRMIIDGGSTENIISESSVKKLQLKTPEDQQATIVDQ